MRPAFQFVADVDRAIPGIKVSHLPRLHVLKYQRHIFQRWIAAEQFIMLHIIAQQIMVAPNCFVKLISQRFHFGIFRCRQRLSGNALIRQLLQPAEARVLSQPLETVCIVAHGAVVDLAHPVPPRVAHKADRLPDVRAARASALHLLRSHAGILVPFS